MANFDKSGMTQAGINLMGKAIGGATIQFTKLVLGDGTMTGEILDLQGVVSPKQNVDVTRIERNDNQCTVGGELLTSSVNQGFWWRECGLYAMDPTEGEILYNYAYSTKPDFIAAADSGMMEEILVSMVATVGTNTNVDVTIDDSMVFATKKIMDKTIYDVEQRGINVNNYSDYVIDGDWSYAFDKAILDAVRLNTMTVIVPDKYIVKRPIHVPEGILIKGIVPCHPINYSTSYSMIEGTEGLETIFIIDGSIASIKNIFLKGNGAEAGIKWARGVGETNIYIRGSYEYMTIQGFKYGMLFDLQYGGGITNFHVKNCTFSYNNYGMYVDCPDSKCPWVNYNSITTCDFANNRILGISISASELVGLAIQGCKFEHNAENALADENKNLSCGAIEIKKAFLTSVSISDCYFEANERRKFATQSEIENYTANGQKIDIGNGRYKYVIDDNELFLSDNTGVIVKRSIDYTLDSTVKFEIGKLNVKNSYFQGGTGFINCTGTYGVAIIDNSSFSKYESREYINGMYVASGNIRAVYIDCSIDPVYKSSSNRTDYYNVKNTALKSPLTGSYADQLCWIYLDSVNGDDKDLGSQAKPLRTFEGLSRFLDIHNINECRVVLKTGHYIIAHSYFVGKYIQFESENGSGAKLQIDKHIESATRLDSIFVHNSHLKFINIEIMFDNMSGASSAQGELFHCYMSTIDFSNVNFTSNSNSTPILTRGNDSRFNFSSCVFPTAERRLTYIESSGNDTNQCITTVSNCTLNSFLTAFTKVGPTSNRPSMKSIGAQFFDTVLGKPIWWNGTKWIDATGTAV